MTLPADELRQAAAHIRKTADWAMPGPWCGYSDEVCTDWDPNSAEYAKYGGDLDVAAGTGGNSDHIALWHPATALLVADFLQMVAERMTDRGFYPEPELNAALAIARAINASKEQP